MKTQFFIVFIFIPFLIKAQTDSDSVLIRIQELNQLCEQADTLTSWEDYDLIISLQNSIANKLIGLLSDHSVENYDIERLLQNEYMNIVSSSDKNIQVFQWDENTGGTFRSSERIVSYHDKKGIRNFVIVEGDEYADYVSGGELWVTRITKLKSPRNIYLIEESAATCGTCYAEYVRTVELTDTGLISYDGFYGDDGYGENDFKTSSFGIDYRWNESNSLVFNPETQVITTSYFDRFSLDSARYFSDTLIFNGEMFVDPVMRKIALLRTLIDQYNNAGQNSDEINNLNEELYNSLADLLLTNSSFESGIDYFLDAAPWEIIKSDDERILIYSWMENPNPSAITYRGNIYLVVYRDYEDQFHLLSGEYGKEKEQSQLNNFDPMFNFYSIQEIVSDSSRSVYLFLGNVPCFHCSPTDPANFAFIVTIIFNEDGNYLNIKNSEMILNNPEFNSEVSEFQFDNTTSELWYTEYIDGPAGKFEHIVRYRFNGNQFIRTDQ